MAYLSVFVALKYGILIQPPTSPRSANICICFGNTSQPPKPRADDNSSSFSFITDAGIHSLQNRYKCTPPDFDLHGINGNFN